MNFLNYITLNNFIKLLSIFIIVTMIGIIPIIVIKITEGKVHRKSVRKLLVLTDYLFQCILLLLLVINMIYILIFIYKSLYIFIEVLVNVFIKDNEQMVLLTTTLVLLIIYPIILLIIKIDALKEYNNKTKDEMNLFSISILLVLLKGISFDILANLINVIIVIVTISKYQFITNNPAFNAVYLYSALCLLFIAIHNKFKNIVVRIDNRIFKTSLILEPYNGLLTDIFRINITLFGTYINTGKLTLKHHVISKIISKHEVLKRWIINK